MTSALVSLLLISATAAIQFKAYDRPDLTQTFFPQHTGWVGADVSASFQLAPDYYIWLWGDTLIGSTNSNNTERKVTIMSHSSLAFTNVSANANPAPSFFLPTFPNGTFNPMGVFSPQSGPPEAYYWIVAGIVTPASHCLCILAQTIVNTPTFFEQLGTDVILVPNWEDPVEQWIYNTSRITQSNGVLTWNNGVTFSMEGSGSEGYLYIIGDNANMSQTVLARITEASMLQFNWSQMQFWTDTGWAVGGAASLRGLLSGKYNEGTLIYNAYMQAWYIISLQAYESFVWLSYAKNLTGPWHSSPVYQIPTQWTKSPFISYAAKAHPEYADPGQIIVTYNTNTNNGLGPMVSDIAIYHPHFVQLDIVLEPASDFELVVP